MRAAEPLQASLRISPVASPSGLRATSRVPRRWFGPALRLSEQAGQPGISPKGYQLEVDQPGGDQRQLREDAARLIHVRALQSQHRSGFVGPKCELSDRAGLM